MLLGEEVKVRLWRIVLPGSVLAVLLAWFSGTFVQYHWQQQQALSSYHEMSALRARLEGEINAAVNLTQGLAAWVAANEDQIDDDRFARFGQTLLRGQSSVRNITLAPGNVIRYVYPIAGNEAAMGLDLNSLHSSRRRYTG